MIQINCIRFGNCTQMCEHERLAFVGGFPAAAAASSSTAWSCSLSSAVVAMPCHELVRQEQCKKQQSSTFPWTHIYNKLNLSSTNELQLIREQP